jgi:hypothetical protein
MVLTLKAGRIWGRNGVELLHLPSKAPPRRLGGLFQRCPCDHTIILVGVRWDVTDK